VAETGDITWLEGGDMFPSYSDETFNTFPQPGYDDQAFSNGYVALPSTDVNTSSRVSAPMAEIDPPPDTFYEPPAVGTTTSALDVTPAELDQYRALGV